MNLTRVYHPTLNSWQDVPDPDTWSQAGWLKSKPKHVDDSASPKPSTRGPAEPSFAAHTTDTAETATGGPSSSRSSTRSTSRAGTSTSKARGGKAASTSTGSGTPSTPSA